jgi:hypothetical protein
MKEGCEVKFTFGGSFDKPKLTRMVLDAETLPQVADVVLVMAQYEGALKAFHDRHFGWNGLGHDWFIK